MYRIIISPEWYPNKQNLLSAIFTKKHIDIIAQKNKVVVAFAIVSNLEDKNYNLIIEDSTYKTIICYYKASNLPFISKYVDFLNYFIAHYKAIKLAKSMLGKVDLFHVHVLPKSAIIPFFYYLFNRIPYFISEHSTIYLRKSSGLLERIIKSKLAQYSKGLSAVSNSLKSAMIANKIQHNNFKVIPNVVDSKAFSVNQMSKSNNISFLHVSRLDEKAKNTIGILKTFDKLSSKYPNIELHIVGGLINEISEAETFKQGLKSRDYIFFNGVKLGADIIPYYHLSNYLVMFSNYETQAVVILEALACGIPVIATNLAALNEYLHSGNSLQVEVKDEIALYNAMEICILKKHHFWKPEEISNEIKRKFSTDKIESDFNDFYIQGLNS